MTKSFSRVAETYDATRGGMDRGRRFGEALARLLPPGSVLEIGIGTGLIAAGLAEHGRDVVGIDISFEMIERARDRIGARVAVGDATRMPIAPGSVDAAYSVWVLHLVDIPSVFREVGRVLKDGAPYFVTGGDVHEATDEPSRITREMYLAIRGPSPDRHENVIAVAAAEGFELAATHSGNAALWKSTTNEMIALIEARSYSALWDLPDEVWERAVEPALRALRALPNRDEPIEQRGAAKILEFRRT